ncbi:MAG: helix-turn-helix domain-containing protein, partial [Gemmatimonadota bacterium]|nr:helix-turn-helix domain-containing protein [Gemmatimonadota bacterium]
FGREVENAVSAPGVEGITPGMTLREVEKRLILSTLEVENNNRTKAAEKLSISVRTLRNKLNEYSREGILVKS